MSDSIRGVFFGVTVFDGCTLAVSRGVAIQSKVPTEARVNISRPFSVLRSVRHVSVFVICFSIRVHQFESRPKENNKNKKKLGSPYGDGRFLFFQFSSPDRQCSKRHHLLSVPFSIRVRHFQFVIFRNEKRSTDKDVAVGSDVVFVVVVVVGFAANVPVGQVGRDGQHADDPEQFGARALPDPLRARLRLGRLQLLFDAADARHVAVALHLQTGARLPRRRRLPLLHRGACPPQFLFDSVLEVFLDRVFLFLVIHCWIIGPVCLIGFYFRIGRVSKVTSGLMSL